MLAVVSELAGIRLSFVPSGGSGAFLLVLAGPAGSVSPHRDGAPLRLPSERLLAPRPLRVERRNACARPAAGVVVQLPVISVSRMTAASLPPNRVENTVMPANLYSGGASLSSRCMVPVRLVASRR